MDAGRAGYSDREQVGATLAGAFTDDPVFRWLIPPEVAGREGRLLAFFTSMARSYLRRNKHVYDVGGVSAAMWSPPGSWRLPVSEMLREGPAAVTAFGPRVVRAVRVQLQVEAAHPSTPPHWYLGYLGTRPGHQGSGHGTALLRAVLDGADRSATPAYLESSNERNLSLYLRHGFQVVEEVSYLGSPSIWRMWRDPR